MRKTAISVTEAARNFADCINRVRYQSATFVLVRNGQPVAQLAPPDEKVCRGADLAGILAEVRLPAEEAAAWKRDLDAARRTLKAPGSKWE
jgi:antitoxin (DNA-binding transcriptional repressor) of toxin-antitoxin stability system